MLPAPYPNPSGEPAWLPSMSALAAFADLMAAIRDCPSALTPQASRLWGAVIVIVVVLIVRPGLHQHPA